jgi:hypothetical protein
MSRITNTLLSPNLWIGVFSLLGLSGIIAMLAGQRTLAFWLLAPLLIGAAGLICVGIPILIVKNRHTTKRQPGVRH